MRWKWILGILGLLIVGSIGIIYLILMTYDFERLKPEIVQAVREATGRVTSPAAKILRVDNLKARLGESDLGGSVVLNLSGERPEVEAALSSPG